MTIISDAGLAFLKITSAIEQVTVQSKQVRAITHDAFFHTERISMAVNQLEDIAKQSFTSAGEERAVRDHFSDGNKLFDTLF